MVGAHVRSRGRGGSGGFGAGSFGCSLLGGFLQVCCQFMSAALDSQDGTVAEKLRPKEDSDWGPFFGGMSVSDSVLSRGLCGR